MVDCGDFVRIDDEVSAYNSLVTYSHCSIFLSPSLLCICLVYVLCIQRKYGYLLSCFRVIETREDYCLVQWMSPLCDPVGHQVTNEFECPLFSLSCVFVVLPASKVCSYLSFVHECTNTCVFTEDVVPVEVEREACSTRRLIFHHDYCNRVFVLICFV